jgi:hypothetical protein
VSAGRQLRHLSTKRPVNGITSLGARPALRRAPGQHASRPGARRAVEPDPRAEGWLVAQVGGAGEELKQLSSPSPPTDNCADGGVDGSIARVSLRVVEYRHKYDSAVTVGENEVQVSPLLFRRTI